MRGGITALLFAVASSEFNVSNIFSSFGVLQRDKSNVIWGFSNSAVETISAVWVDGASYSSGPTDAGVWRVNFPAALASLKPFNLTFTSSLGSPSTTLASLLIGDVFFCSGQSNMGAVQIQAMWNVSDIVSQAAAFSAGLRLFQVDGHTESAVPLLEWPLDALVPWQPPLGQDNNSNKSLLSFSAACYIMGSTLFDEHLARGVPIGLIHSSHGGTSIQSWASPDGVSQCGDASEAQNYSSILYNSNFHPMTVGPLSISGVYWYQVRWISSAAGTLGPKSHDHRPKAMTGGDTGAQKP